MLGLATKKARPAAEAGAIEPPNVIEIHRRRLAELGAQRSAVLRQLDDVAATAGDGDTLLDQLDAIDGQIARQRQVLEASERGLAALSAQATAKARAAEQKAAEAALTAYEAACIEFERLQRAAVDQFADRVLPAWDAFHAVTPAQAEAQLLGARHRPRVVFAMVTAYLSQRIAFPIGTAAPSRPLETLAEVFRRKAGSLLPWKKEA